MAGKSSPSDAAIRELRELGLAYPGAHLKSPWPGHEDLAVKDKTFAYLPPEGEPFSISCKLPDSAHLALMLPYVTPTGYGLGKSGWVTAQPPPGTPIDVAMFKQWIDESYRAQAPKALVKQLATPSAPASKLAAKPAAKQPAAKQPAVKKRVAQKPATNKPAAQKLAVKKRAAAKKPTNQPAAKKRAVNKPAAKEPAAAKKRAVKTPAAKKRAAQKPAAKKRAAKKPAARRAGR